MLIFLILNIGLGIALYGLWYISSTLKQLNESTEQIFRAMEKLENVSDRIQSRYTEQSDK